MYPEFPSHTLRDTSNPLYPNDWGSSLLELLSLHITKSTYFILKFGEGVRSLDSSYSLANVKRPDNVATRTSQRCLSCNRKTHRAF